MDAVRSARNYLIAQGVTIEEKVVYNIYKCGHAVKNSLDPKRMIRKKQLIKKQQGIKYGACPECMEGFHIKFKRCACGREKIGTRLVDGFCLECWPERKALLIEDDTPVLLKWEIRQHVRASAVRYNCAGRAECLLKSVKNDPEAETLLCHGCDDYDPIKIESNLSYERELRYEKNKYF